MRRHSRKPGEAGMLNRKEFVKTCAAAICGSGLCGRAVAETNSAQTCDADGLKAVTGQMDAAQLRFAKLVEQISQDLPRDTGNKLLRGLGRQCAATYKAKLLDRFRGDIHGFLQEGLRSWMAEARYDEAAGTIRIVDKQTKCVCPAVKQGMTPGKFCECTLGWQEEVYSMILGKPAVAEIEESILRGGKRCVYRIKVI
jgi:predicted hydrocarbon binding protein